VPYVNFIAPALIAISAMNSSFFECTYGSYVRMYYQKTFDAIIATPVSLEEVIGGELLWGATRSLIYASLMLPVVILFRAVDPATSLLIIPVAFLTGLLFSSIAMCFTAIAPSIDTLNYPSFLFITPMFLLSGTFFPVSTLPAIVQDITLILPLTHVVALIRGITLNAFTISMLGNLAWMAVVTPVVFLLSINLMKRRLIV
jgi:lipooligosaccharide transport system permease protein